MSNLPPMRRVESSNVAAVGFIRDDQDSGRLFVTFAGGASYCYTGVPLHMFDALLSAPSTGKYIAAHIRGAFPFEKVS